MTFNDYLFRGGIEELDSDVAELIRHETARQQAKLIMIPSESTVPYAVRAALGSAFHNIYAEGYPLENSRRMSQAEILDYGLRLPEFRRNADQRYYKGTEYANILESLARRRAAELFAANGYGADDLYVNVQPLSGAPANNAAYTALLDVGDTVMGMDLIMGGHLTHGSPVNRSGKFYNIVSYGIDPVSEKLDYGRMRELALEHKPRLIIGGFSSYPYAADWNAYREIADEAGAYLLADVAHVAGLIAAGVYPNPVGIADVVSFTTHKTLNGPRGAVLITHRRDLSSRLDRAVFPGEQGGPHINAMAGLAVALRLAATDQFRQLQSETRVNARRLAEKLGSRGLRVPHGGTNTHLLLLDCKSITGADGTALSGDMAARILDLAGIVVNRQTIPGDVSALRPSGIRLGTTWLTQRGISAADIDLLGDIIADVLDACLPFSLTGRLRALARAKVDFDALHGAARRSQELAARLGIDCDAAADGYPHMYYLDAAAEKSTLEISVRGDAAGDFLHIALTSDVAALKDGDRAATRILEKTGAEMARGEVTRVSAGEYRLILAGQAKRAAAWLRSLSDGYVLIDDADVYAKAPGPVAVRILGEGGQRMDASVAKRLREQSAGYAAKTYHIGMNGAEFIGNGDVSETKSAAIGFEEDSEAGLPPKFVFDAAADDADGAEPAPALRQTPLHSLHRELGAKMAPFAGYDMPLWYRAVSDEHEAARKGAGVFDVAHMGVFDLSGRGAENFLDFVTSNDVKRLKVGSSHYSYILDTDGIPLDDLMIYRLAEERFMVVVNASNNDKVWQWLKSLIEGVVLIDPAMPSRRIEGTDRIKLRDLRQPQAGADQRVDIALQGPGSRDALLQLEGSEADKDAVKRLRWAGVAQVNLGGFDLIVSRTGYTGERVAYELFVHPSEALALFGALIEAGATPCGLAARDSLRTEAGLPLYGLELAGELNLNPADAGFGSYVKLYKPFFIGKGAFVAHEAQRKHQVSRFRMDNRGARPAHFGDPIVHPRGRVVGKVTSCNIDSDGFQVGQALMERGFRKPGTQLALYAGAARAKVTDLGQLSLSQRIKVPEPITVLTRFPRRS